MTPDERRRRFYALNGQLEHIKRQLGAAFGILTSLTNTGDDHARGLSTLYADLKRLQDSIFRKYLT